MTILLSLPFVLFLLLIAIAPLLFKKWWHAYYRHVSILAGGSIVLYYIIGLKDFHHPADTFFDYFSFIVLLASLYIVAGGIYIKTDVKATPLLNCTLLVAGILTSNVIGSIGAAVLFIRPFIRINQHRFRPYLVVFFIFLVCNVGGALTPLGNPPLFLGFLKGVPFEWTMIQLLPAWLTAVVLLLAIFLVLDIRNKTGSDDATQHSNIISIQGGKNILLLLFLAGTIFLEPAKFSWLPSIKGYSFVREGIQIAIAFIAFRTSDKKALFFNRFTFNPILEVAFLFFGIFFSMMPALQYLQEYFSANKDSLSLTPGNLYWLTGSCSGILDNAPSYLTFLASSMSLIGLDVNKLGDVLAFASSDQYLLYLKSISISSVFFGAFTYIGNGPNFIVKDIAEEHFRMPGFFEFIYKYAIPYLLPVLVIVWFLFIS